MSHDIVTNLQTCMPAVLEFLDGNLNLLYYSHIPVALIAALLGIFILWKGREKASSRVFFALSSVFVLWSILDLFTWLSSDTRVIMFAWSIIGLVEALFFFLTFYFLYAYTNKKDAELKYKIGGALLLLPLIATMPLNLNLLAFDLDYCYAIENDLTLYYKYLVEAIAFVGILILFIKSFVEHKSMRKQVVLLFSGSVLFLASFFVAIFLSGYLVETGVSTGYGLEIYGLFGTLIFMTIIIFLIVRFQGFNMKFLGAQALVWTMIVLTGSQFFYQLDAPVSSLVLTGLTLVMAAIIGLLVLRSVRKLDVQKEMLEQSNRNQQSLLHFITHQVKGYMTKTRNIFDGLIAGDYGPVTDDRMKEIIKYGFNSETKGVETVQSILRASDLKTGRVEFKHEKINLSKLVAEIAEKAKEIALKKGLDFTFEIDPNVEATVDSLRMSEVFKNLMDNAVIYTKTGTVHIVLKDEGDRVRFAVVDTGFGLTEEDKDKLFTEGGKGDESLDVNIDSTGYGLFIAKKIVDQHGGKVGALSEGRGKGSEFFVILPKMK